MMSSSHDFILKLAGPVRLIRSDGLDITPKAAKLKALLVLIGTGTSMCRPRAFLQDMLWSRSDPERGGASLRQALSAARKLPGSVPDLLIIDNGSAALNPARIRIDLALPRNCIEIPEFAEGLDVADPEFEDWLRDRRSEFADACEKLPASASAMQVLAERVAPPKVIEAARPAIVICPPVCDDPSVRAHAEILSADVATHIAQIGDADVLLDHRTPGHGKRLAVKVRAMRQGPGMSFQVQLSEVDVPRAIWFGDVACRNAPGVNQNPQFDRLLIEAAAASSAYFGQLGPEGEPDDAMLAYQMYAHFPFQAGPKLERFEAWFSRHADTAQTRAIQLAWRARLRLVSLLENARPDNNAFGEATEFSRAAISLSTDDPVVSAIAAEVALHVEGKVELASELARLSAERRPRNPFIQAIYAQALARSNRPKQGYAVAQRALHLAAGQPNLSWWHAICASTAIQLHRFSEARKHAELSHFLAPTFRPPLRFLSALRFHDGDEIGAARALCTLQSLEPGFSLQRMADRSYPVASLRGTKLLAVTESGLL